jgi:hypothetical protein
MNRTEYTGCLIFIQYLTGPVSRLPRDRTGYETYLGNLYLFRLYLFEDTSRSAGWINAFRVDEDNLPDTIDRE